MSSLSLATLVSTKCELTPQSWTLVRGSLVGKYSEETKLSVVKDYCSGTAGLKVVARRHGVNVTSLFKWRRHYLAGDFGMPDVPLPEAPALNWLPVAVAEPLPEAPACPSSDSGSTYEVECGEVRLRLSTDTPIATLIKIVRGLAR
ncbi:transposase [Burkholderia sp. Ax-1724]|nr:transposase [Burkholderia sp. Ax-1724]